MKTANGTASDTRNDAELLRAICNRSEAAMGELFRRYSKLVYSVAIRVVRDAQLAEDLLQDVFMQLWTKPINAVSQNGLVGPYLAMMARNRSIDLLRKRKNLVGLDQIQLASSFNLAEISEQKVLLDRLRISLTELPADQVAALSMAFFDGLSHAEIAELTGVPLGTIKTRIRTALQKLGRSSRP